MGAESFIAFYGIKIAIDPADEQNARRGWIALGPQV
jgi:hypothetical protein